MAVHKSESNYLKVGNGTPWNTKVESDKVQLRSLFPLTHITKMLPNNAQENNHIVIPMLFSAT